MYNVPGVLIISMNQLSQEFVGFEITKNLHFCRINNYSCSGLFLL